jgi:hypothetical protein
VKGEKRATAPPRYCPKVIGCDGLVVEWFYDPSGDPLAGYVRSRRKLTTPEEGGSGFDHFGHRASEERVLNSEFHRLCIGIERK